MVGSSNSDGKDLAELVELVGWTGFGKDLNWYEVEKGFGTALPSDYKDLVSRFPSGSFQTYLSFYLPTESGMPIDIKMALDSKRRIQEQRDDFPFSFFPVRGGLLPWGGIEVDFECCWSTQPEDPDAWPVVVVGSMLDEYAEYDGTMTQFIVDLIKGQTGIAALDYIAEEEPDFTPFAPGIAGN
jgi:hypothetical protein